MFKPFALLARRRFAPLFWVQFLIALNDNIYKNALIILITYHSISAWGFKPAQLTNLAAGLFILPFFLFSASCGFIADRFEKTQLIRGIKLAEIMIMLLACLAFYLNSMPLLMGVLFLLGLQATFFGPLKYSILPQHLAEQELLQGNGLIEMGTFIAILLGTLLGSSVVNLPKIGLYIINGLLLGSALLGFLLSLFIPKAPANDSQLRLSLNIFAHIGLTLKIARQNSKVFGAILAISWFWLYGALFLTQLPSYVKNSLGGNEYVFSLFLALFSLGIALGSTLCAKLSDKTIDFSLVAFGSIGMSLFSIGMYFCTPRAVDIIPLTLGQFIYQSHALGIIICLLGLSVFSGFFTVPLYALIQHLGEPKSRSRIIAANNIMNALFMVLAALGGIIFLSFKFSVAQLFLLIGLGNGLVALYYYNYAAKQVAA